MQSWHATDFYFYIFINAKFMVALIDSHSISKFVRQEPSRMILQKQVTMEGVTNLNHPKQQQKAVN